MYHKWEFGKGPAYRISFWFFCIWWSIYSKSFGINLRGNRYRIFIQRLAFPNTKPYVRFEFHYPNRKMPNHPKCYNFQMDL